MSDQKIDGFYSEYSIEDNASQTLAKIGKEEQALQKVLKSGKKETAARTKATTDRGRTEEKERKAAEKRRKDEDKEEKNKAKAFEKEKKSKESLAKATANKAGNAVSGASNAAGNLASGNVVGTIAGILPFGLGALIAGTAAAIEKAAAAIQSSANFQKQQAATGRAGFALGNVSGLGGKFSSKEREGAVRALGEEGVTGLSARQISTINKEADRLGSLTEAIQNILGGTGFRTLGQQGKNLESVAGAIPRTTQTADFRAKAILDQLEHVQATQSQLYNKGKTASALALSFQNSADRIERNRQVSEQGMIGKNLGKIENAAKILDSTSAKLTGQFAEGGAEVLSDASETIDELIKDPLSAISDIIGSIANPFASRMKKEAKKKRASGGSVYPGESVIVGDGGEPEVFQPSTGGRIIPRSAMGGLSGGGSNVVFNISGVTDPEAVARIVNERFASFMNRYAGNEFAAELGMRGGSF